MTSTLEKAISRAYKKTSAAVSFIEVFTWIGIVLCVILAPFTLGVSLIYLLLVPVEFAFARMVNEQVKQTELMKVMIRVQAGELVDEPEEMSTAVDVEAQRRRLAGLKATDALEED